LLPTPVARGAAGVRVPAEKRIPEQSPDAGIAHQYDAKYDQIMRTISLKLPEDLLAQLAEQAKARRVTKSALVREGLAKVLYPAAQPLSCYDLAVDLAGSLKGLPKDLADNPKYLDGFGEGSRF
jgi:hypothetical protein